MKLTFLELSGFRGYKNTLRIDFADAFTIIDGRNGVGKSTVFDAIEFAITGRLGKYDEQKSAGETFSDYVWWKGEGNPPNGRFVTVGLKDSEREFSITRKEFEEPDSDSLQILLTSLCDIKLAPSNPLQQICTNAIIRDEHITKFSLDLKDADRYTLLRDALGANDSDEWIERGAKLLSAAKKRASLAQLEVAKANMDVALATRRLDEVRANSSANSSVAEVVLRLQKAINSTNSADQLEGPVREYIAATSAEISNLRKLADQWGTIQNERLRLLTLTKELELANSAKSLAGEELKAISDQLASAPLTASSLAEDAKNLVILAALGRRLGLRDSHCPLCSAEQSDEDFIRGIEAAENIASRMNEGAARAAQQETLKKVAEQKLADATRLSEAAELKQKSTLKRLSDFDKEMLASDVPADANADQLKEKLERALKNFDGLKKDLLVLETLRIGGELERAQRAEIDAKNRLTKAQDRFGRTRKAESSAQALHDASRRAAGETLGRRLERVLPLMSELYRRLRPHPIWSDIEYSIRGDVKRFLTLQVGEELNPQFLFSSGQRRATGLAFLLSVNLSLAWSKWRSILLDDPVQHVDDFRAVHLAELAAQLVADGRQIICAVEDAALADLMCRRLPVRTSTSAKRITLGPDIEGSMTKIVEKSLSPLTLKTLTQLVGNQPHVG